MAQIFVSVVAHFFIDFYTLAEVVNISIFSVSKKYFRPAVRILKLSKSFKILLIERAVGFLPPRTHPPLLCPGHLLRGFLTVSFYGHFK